MDFRFRGRERRPAVRTNLTLIYAMLRYSVGVCREVAMGQDRSETTEQVVKFPPKQQSGNPTDEAGQAVIAQIRKAAELANENCDRAMALAHKLAMQLRAAEDRITQLEAEAFETGLPEPKGGFKRSTAKSSKSSSPRDQPLVPNKRWSHRIQMRNQVSLPLPKTAAS